jgi:hypothetical protein
MTADTLHTHREFAPRVRAWVAVVCATGLLALVGCKTDKDVKGTGVSNGKNKDPLVHGPTRIPRQDLPVPDRATGPKGGKAVDPLTMPTGGKASYTDDPERFKGTFIPGERSTPAALAGRIKDGEELKIDSPGVTLTPAGGAVPGGMLTPPEGVEPLFGQLEKYGVKREDRSLEREGAGWVFRASLPLGGNGARRQYTGAGATAAEAVKQVLDQIATDPK